MKTANELKKDVKFKADLLGNALLFNSTWGLFSPRGIDEGSALLLKHTDFHDGEQTLDLGCGYGALGVSVAKLCPSGSVHMIDKDYIAVEYARKNAKQNGVAKNCEVYLSNGFSEVGKMSEVKFDNIIANLPAKVGRELLYILLCDAKTHLKPGGQMVVVIVAGLKDFIKRNFKEVFGNYKKLKQGRAYIVAKAVKE